MKKSAILFSIASLFLLSSCMEQKINPKISIDESAEREKYGDKITITPSDETVEFSKSKITISPKVENATYTISGYFKGQLVVNTKNTIIKLQNAFLENTSGKPAIKTNAKTEISSSKDSVNYIITSGRTFSKIGTISANRGLVLGGSGTLYVKNKVAHAIEAEGVKIKGSGKFFFEGCKKGSALNCDSLEVEKEKTFTAYFLNSKNGIKADKHIQIESGNFHFYNNSTAIKVESKSQIVPDAVVLSGGTFQLFENENFINAPENTVDTTGAEIQTES